MEQNGISKLDLKRLNRTEILRLITKNGPMSRIDISYNLHLTRAAVTIITNEMISQGIIYEKGEEKLNTKATRGRKKILLDICENYKFSFGVVIDEKKLSVGLANIKGQTLQKEVINLHNEGIDSITNIIYDKIREILSQNYLTQDDLLGIAVCVSDNALPLFETKTKEQAIQTVKVLLKKRFTVPLLVDGTTESLAVAEMTFNEAVHNYSGNMLFLRYGYDIDAAIMIGDKIYKGSKNNVGWFSHLVFKGDDGDRCVCGKKGCLITKVSIKGIARNVKNMYSKEKTPKLFEESEGDISKVDFSVENLKNINKDEAVQNLYSNSLRYLLLALENLSMVLDPDRIVIFGYAFENVWELDDLKKILMEDSGFINEEGRLDLPEHYKTLMDKIILSSIYDCNIHLAGNGLCVKNLFINTGGY